MMILTKHPDSEAQGMKAIGYWRSAHQLDLPNPLDYVDEEWNPAERAVVATYLANGKHTLQWRGWSCCRICGIHNGSSCLSDGTYVWPQGFAHYIEQHSVRPPQEFVDHVLQRVNDAEWAQQAAQREDEAGGFPGVTGAITAKLHRIANKITR